MSPIKFNKSCEIKYIISKPGPIPVDYEVDMVIEESQILEDSNEIEYEEPTYTHHVQTLLVNNTYESGTPEYENLIYQSAICRLVDSVDYQLERFRNNDELLMTNEEGNIHLNNLNACGCCHEHMTQRAYRECRYESNCLCRCSELYEEVCMLVNSSN